nr:MAG TPA: Exonuclease [Caudoviricetes sp.]
MKNLISTREMSHEKWLEYRKKGIGGSDAGAICGLNPYVSPVTVWADKKSKIPPKPDNEAMRQGRDFEDIVAKRFCEETGKKVRRCNYIIQHDEYPFMLANVDRLVVGESAGLECKTCSAYNADKWNDGKIPMHYEIQCHHYMAVTGLDKWYIACLILGVGFVWHTIERDEEIIKSLESVEEDFWNRYIIGKEIPDPDGSTAYTEMIKQIYPESSDESPVDLYGYDSQIDRIMEINDLMRTLETEKSQIEQSIKVYMKEAERAESNNYRVTWKTTVSNRIDSSRLKKEMPDVYKKYLKPSESRRFTIKNLQEE